MRRACTLLISASVGLAIFSMVTLAQAPAQQGAPPGRGGPPPVPLSQVTWEPWNNTGLRAIPQNVEPDGPAPRRDLTGIWDPARGGIGARGARNPAPLTEWGQKKGGTHKSGDGIRQVPADQINDPLSTMGDPGGYPRQLLFELRHVQFLHTPQSVVALFMWERRWRVIWTDSRQLPGRSGSTVVWLLGWSMGRRLHLRRQLERNRRTDVAGQRRQSTQQRAPRRGTLASHQREETGAYRYARRSQGLHPPVGSAR